MNVIGLIQAPPGAYSVVLRPIDMHTGEPVTCPVIGWALVQPDRGVAYVEPVYVETIEDPDFGGGDLRIAMTHDSTPRGDGCDEHLIPPGVELAIGVSDDGARWAVSVWREGDEGSEAGT